MCRLGWLIRRSGIQLVGDLHDHRVQFAAPLLIAQRNRAQGGVGFHLADGAFADLVHVGAQQLGEAHRYRGAARMPGPQLLLDQLDQFLDLRRFDQEVVHLALDRRQGALEGRKAGENEVDAIRLGPPHGADHGEAVAGLSDVEVRDQDVEGTGGHLHQRLRHRSRAADLESMHPQDRRKGNPEARLVIHE